MIIARNTPVIGSGLPRGIYSCGRDIIGGTESAEPPASIDLTAETLDSRVTYSGPAHYFWNKDGLLELATAQEWPLEYRDGVAVGRHEPEPAATNYQGNSQADTVEEPDYISSSGTTITTTTGPNGSDVALFDADRLKAALYSNAAAAWLVSEYTPESSESFVRAIMNASLASESQLRTYIARRDSGTYTYALSQTIPAGSVTASFFRAVLSSGVAAGMLQVEIGSLATSPIITPAGQAATRLASTVTVNTTGVTSITVNYDSGESDTYSTPDSSYSLPFAGQHWGERYVTKIDFEV